MVTKNSSSSTSVLNQLSQYNPSSSNFIPKSSEVPQTTIEDVIQTQQMVSYNPVQASTVGAGVQQAAAQSGESAARSAIGYATQLAGGANDPLNLANFSRGTQNLNSALQQNAQNRMERLMQAGLTKEETKRQKYTQDTSLAAARLGAQSTLGAAREQSRATVEAARAQAEAQRAIAGAQIEAARINAQTGLIGNIFGNVISGLTSNYQPQTQYWGGY